MILEKFLKRIDGELVINKNVWECACGQKHLANVLIKNGYNVKCSDLIKRIDDETIVEKDFLSYDEVYNGDILTNPPIQISS